MSKEKSIHRKPAVLPKDYAAWVVSLKKRIAGARQKALFSANAEQIKSGKLETLSNEQVMEKYRAR